jgi:ATP-dependent DNA helicase RecG
MVPSKTEFDKLLFFCKEPKTLSEIITYMGYNNRSKFRNKYIKPLLDNDSLLMTDPGHPTSKFQRYITNNAK